MGGRGILNKADRMDEEKPEAETSVKTETGSDDNLMAAIAHTGVIVTVTIALIIWIVQK